MEGQDVEAIEEGRIVKVSEDYARREGLPILRRGNFRENRGLPPRLKKSEEESVYGIDELRKPLWQRNKVAKDLVDNFHWKISRTRRQKSISRKQLAEMMGESEKTVKMLENGLLPSDDFVVINKVEDALGIRLRKKQETEYNEMRNEIDPPQPTLEEGEVDIFGSDIELVEED